METRNWLIHPATPNSTWSSHGENFPKNNTFKIVDLKFFPPAVSDIVLYFQFCTPAEADPGTGKGLWLPWGLEPQNQTIAIFPATCNGLRNRVAPSFCFVFRWFEVGRVIWAQMSQIGVSQIKAPISSVFQKYVYSSFMVKMRIDLGTFGLFWFILGWG